MKASAILRGCYNVKIKILLVVILIILTIVFGALSFFVFIHNKGIIELKWQYKPVYYIDHEIGYAYKTDLLLNWMSSHNGPSPAKLFENGIPLGAANSLHDDIRNIGNGRYSFWYDTLYFSSSDNSDPRINGRTYEIYWPVPINHFIRWSIYFVTFVTFITTIITNILIYMFYRENMRKHLSRIVSYIIKIITILLLFIGIFLFSINIIGLFIPLRNMDIYKLKIGKKGKITLTEKELYNVINNRDLNNEKYIIVLNESIYKGIAHYWRDEGIYKYNLRIPIYENYLLFFASYIYPKTYKKYEFANYKKAIERGVGYCSQYSIIISEILKEKGIESKIIGLNGHVVATAKVDKNNNKWWVVDPDYCVVIKHSIEEIENNPEIIRNFYLKKGYNDETIDILIEIYRKEGNSIFESVKDYTGDKKYNNEYASYKLIWIIPLFFITPYFIYFFIPGMYNKLRICRGNKNSIVL